MAGLNHDFLLLSRDEFKYWGYSELHNDPSALLIHDDIIRYINDTLNWITCYTPVRRDKMHERKGLNLYGETIIKQEGAAAANKIFNLWAELFACSPKVLKLTGGFTWIEGEDPEKGTYEIIRVERDKLVNNFRQLASYASQVVENDHLYILHLGI